MRRPVSPHWWDTDWFEGEPLRAVLARHDVSAIFRYLRTRKVSLTDIADATGLTVGRVSEIASGARAVTHYAVLERIAIGLNIPPHYMALGADDMTRGLRQTCASAPARYDGPLDYRELLGVVASIAVGAIPSDVDRWLPPAHLVVTPDRITAADVETLRAVTAFHWRLDAVAGGGTCLHSALGYVACATRLLEAASVRDSVAVELRVALAHLHNLAGWVAHDVDQHDTARRHLTQSLVLARQTNTLPLLSNTLYRLGRISLHQGRPDDALHLFGLGQLAAQRSGCHASVAILHANTAWAYAMLGNDTQVVDSLARARTELDQADPDTAPEWTRFALADADNHGISAVVYTELARHPQHRRYADTAGEHATEAVRLRRPEDRRSLIFDVISVASASILSGDLDTAGRYAVNATALAEDGMRSLRVIDRLAALWQLAEPHAERHPKFAELSSGLARLRDA